MSDSADSPVGATWGRPCELENPVDCCALPFGARPQVAPTGHVSNLGADGFVDAGVLHITHHWRPTRHPPSRQRRCGNIGLSPDVRPLGRPRSRPYRTGRGRRHRHDSTGLRRRIVCPARRRRSAHDDRDHQLRPQRQWDGDPRPDRPGAGADRAPCRNHCDMCCASGRRPSRVPNDRANALGAQHAPALQDIAGDRRALHGQLPRRGHYQMVFGTAALFRTCHLRLRAGRTGTAGYDPHRQLDAEPRPLPDLCPRPRAALPRDRNRCAHHCPLVDHRVAWRLYLDRRGARLGVAGDRRHCLAVRETADGGRCRSRHCRLAARRQQWPDHVAGSLSRRCDRLRSLLRPRTAIESLVTASVHAAG